MRSLAGRAWAWAQRHPLATVALVASAWGLVWCWLIWNQRLVGNLDPDEAGYVATALRFQRVIDPSAPGDLLREVMGTVTGPLVPLLSVVPLTLGPRDVRSALLVQPVLLVVMAVATAGACRRIATPAHAILAGCLAVAVPTSLMAAQTYWLGLGAAAAYACALWVIASEGALEGRRRWLLGLAVAAALLSRTMAVGFLVPLLAAGLIVSWGNKARMRGLLLGLVLGLLLAAPWYVANWDAVWGYLFGNGYGTNAAAYGSGTVPARILRRAHAVGLATFFYGAPLLPELLGGLVVLGSGAALWWRLGPRGPIRGWTDRQRVGMAFGTYALLGIVVLATTTNWGIWFELPLVPAVLAVGVAAVPHLPRRAASIVRPVLWVLALAGPLVVAVTGYGYIDRGAKQYDSRFEQPRSAAARRAAGQWEALNREVAARVGDEVGRDSEVNVLVSGNMYTTNLNSLGLAAELDGWRMTAVVPDSGAPAEEIERDLADRDAKVLVVVRSYDDHFLADRRWKRVEEIARQEDWREVKRWKLPPATPGEVLLFLPPAASRRAGT